MKKTNKLIKNIKAGVKKQIEADIKDSVVKQFQSSSKKELKNRWRMQLKFSAIANYYDLIEDNGKALSEDSDDAKEETPKSKKELEASARKTTLTSLDEYFEFADDLERKDWFSNYIADFEL